MVGSACWRLQAIELEVGPFKNPIAGEPHLFLEVQNQTF
jgi:hypothetical protein